MNQVNKRTCIDTRKVVKKMPYMKKMYIKYLVFLCKNVE